MSCDPSAVGQASADGTTLFLRTTRPPAVFGYAAPHDAETIRRWQAELDHAVGYRPQLSRLVLRWEPGDPWEPLGRYVLWQGVDPKYATAEPWLVKAGRGPSPRSTGHWCDDGYCGCLTKKHRWVQGATRVLDAAAWRLYRETGLIGTRWWVVQGSQGGHRFQLDRELDALEMKLRVLRGLPPDTPSVGQLPYAPFDQRVLDAIQRYRRAAICFKALEHVERTGKQMDAEEQQQAEAAAEALWQWTGAQAEELWHQGGELLPRYMEDTFGRVPVHKQAEIRAANDPDRIHEQFIRGA